MSKSKTIIAGLGVVAALGTAALPLTSFAATKAAVTGNVDLYVEVLPAIAMTITGNNDAATQLYVTDPVTAGIDVYSDAEGNAVGSVENHPVSTANGTNADVTSGSDTIKTTTSTMKSSSYTSILPNHAVHGDSNNNFASTITVYTNNKAGYTLGISSVGALSNGTETIPATGTVGAGTSSWGYAVDTPVSTDWASGDANYAYSDNSSIKQTAAVTGTSGSVTKVYYGVSTAPAQVTGVYTDTIIYTATTN